MLRILPPFVVELFQLSREFGDTISQRLILLLQVNDFGILILDCSSALIKTLPELFVASQQLPDHVDALNESTSNFRTASGCLCLLGLPIK